MNAFIAPRIVSFPVINPAPLPDPHVTGPDRRPHGPAVQRRRRLADVLGARRQVAPHAAHGYRKIRQQFGL
uniref:Uncharacterized protein n=1 Tax=Steinernema glaseri TaxID=37863 RepID=A0A1I7YXY7_9BILA